MAQMMRKPPDASVSSAKSVASKRQKTSSKESGTATPPPFEGLEKPGLHDMRILNGASENGFETLLTWLRGEGSNDVFHVAMMWRDESTNFSPVSVKHCTPSKPCEKWFCTCGRTVRAPTLCNSLVGALILRQQTADGPSPTGIFLFVGESKELQGGSCYAPQSERWAALSQLLTERKVLLYNAHVLLMPLLSWLNVHKKPIPSKTQIIDTKVAAWLIKQHESSQPERFEFGSLWSQYCHGHKRPKFSPSTEAEPCGSSTVVIRRLFNSLLANVSLGQTLLAKLSDLGMMNAAQHVEMPSALILSSMEVLGVCFDKEKIENNAATLDAELSRLEAEIQTTAGNAFNVSSAEQTSRILYDQLKLPRPPTAASKKFSSVDKHALEVIKQKHPVVPVILEHRSVSKIRSTFTTSLSQLAVPSGASSHRIHSHWNTISVETGRISSSLPNLQQTPREVTSLGSGESISTRDAFVASDGFVFVAFDYSQIEMRVLAHLCEDEHLMNLFRAPQGDVYRLVASRLLQKPVGLVDASERQLSKTVALGVIYGMGCQQLALRFNISEGRARSFIQAFFSAFPAVQRWAARMKSSASQRGFVTTIAGRRRHVATSDAKAAHTKVVNSIVQGSAADILKFATCRVHERLEEEESTAVGGRNLPRLALQVHDENVFEIPNEAIPYFVKIIRSCMENLTVRELKFRVPLTTNVSVGPTWGAMVAFDDGESS